MNFTVRWAPDGKSERHHCWVEAADPAAVREAAERAEELLAETPEQLGSHIAEDLWKFVIGPIAVYFTIDCGNRIVRIENVALLAGHRHP